MENITFTHGFSFIGPSVFLAPIYFRNCKINVLQTYVNHFKGTVEFHNCEIGEIELHGQFYDEFVMKNCRIGGCFRIIDTTFHKNVTLHKNDFIGGANIFDKHDSFGAVELKEGYICFSGELGYKLEISASLLRLGDVCLPVYFKNI